MAIEKKWRMLGLLAVVGLSLGIYWNHPPGYCFKERRIMSDEELLEGALLSFKSRMKLDGSETSIQAYLAKHHGCCEISRGGISFFDRNKIYGTFAFEFNDKEFDGHGDRYYVKDFVMDGCGNVIEHTGSSVSVPPPGFKTSTQRK